MVTSITRAAINNPSQTAPSSIDETRDTNVIRVKPEPTTDAEHVLDIVDANTKSKTSNSILPQSSSPATNSPMPSS